MNYKKIFNVVGVVVVAVVFSVGCGDGGGGGGENPVDPDNPNNGGGGGGKGNDISKYRTIQIGSQKWMAENLDNDVEGSVCYGRSSSNCTKYGRLYTWEAAKTACPSGWHLPSDAEWTQLTDFVGGESGAGKKLKATSGWGNDGNGTDDYQFSAFPGGYGYSGGNFSNAGADGYWWSSTQWDALIAWSRYMGYGNENVNRRSREKTQLFSVRCVQD